MCSPAHTNVSETGSRIQALYGVMSVATRRQSGHTAPVRPRSYPPGIKLVLAVYVLAFAFGACVHLAILLGLWGPPPHPVSPALAHGYDTLAFLDPLVIVLLFRFPRAGLALALATMLADVGVNTFVASMSPHPAVGAYATDYGALANDVFLGFVLGSAPFLWPHFGRKDEAAASKSFGYSHNA